MSESVEVGRPVPTSTCGRGEHPGPGLDQLAEQAPIDVAFLRDGPDDWNFQITRRGPESA